jgi:hypothetical protein
MIDLLRLSFVNKPRTAGMRYAGKNLHILGSAGDIPPSVGIDCVVYSSLGVCKECAKST